MKVLSGVQIHHAPHASSLAGTQVAPALLTLDCSSSVFPKEAAAW